MSLRSKLHNQTAPVIFYEIIPPTISDSAELDDRLRLVGEVAGMVDVINIPEIREEVARGARSGKLRERMEPRAFAKAIRDAHKLETAVNRVTVHADREAQLRWLQASASEYGVQDLILVGGESNKFTYPGPSVAETARLAKLAGQNFLLGGITIPSREDEYKRVIAKHSCGIEFFTTQVLLESAHTIALLRALEGVAARLILSFTPISHPRDLPFLEWLGVTVPGEVAAQFTNEQNPEAAARASIELAKNILRDVIAQATPRTPALGIQVERITKRNSAAAVRMLAELADFYPKLLRDRAASLSSSQMR